MLVFNCPSCNATLQAIEAHAGKTVQCPECKQLSVVPQPPPDANAEAITANPGPAVSSTSVTTVDPPHPSKQGSDDDRDERRRPRREPASSGTGAAAGLGIGMTILIVCGVAGCCVVGFGGIMAALLIPATQKVREAAGRANTSNNMKQIAIACHNHHDANKFLPSPRMGPMPPAMISPELSWRVTILPYIEQAGMFNQFDMNDKWDGPRNLPFLSQRPFVYENKARDTPDNTVTHFQYFTGPKTVFADPAQKVSLMNIPDGTSNTILFAEALTPVPWSKPADMAVAPNEPLPLPPDRFLAAMADGSVRMIDRRKVDDRILRMAIDPNDGQALPNLD